MMIQKSSLNAAGFLSANINRYLVIAIASKYKSDCEIYIGLAIDFIVQNTFDIGPNISLMISVNWIVMNISASTKQREEASRFKSVWLRSDELMLYQMIP